MSGDGIELHSEIELPRFLLKAGEAITRGDHYFRDVLEALPAAIYTTTPPDASPTTTRLPHCCGGSVRNWVRASGAVRGNSIGLTAARFRTINARWRWRSKKAGPTEAWKPWRSGRKSKYRSSPIRPPFTIFISGTLVGAVNMLVDITDRKRAEESALRLASIVEFSDDAIISKDLDGVITSWNRGAQALFGYTAREAVGNSVRTLIPPDRLDEESEILARIRRGEHIEHYETVRRRKDGTLIDISLTVSPVKNAAGEIVGASKIARNISERKRAEEALHLIVDESKHRIRNTLATVQAIATQTLHASDEERLAFVARLSALGRAHDLLSVENWSRAKIGDVVNQALAPFRDKAYERFVVEGPEDLWTSSNHASLLTMALHELATNASKYGALANNSGQVRLSWELVSQDQESRLRLCWTESGGPPVTAPSHAGFGSFLMNRVLKAERGEVRLEYKPQGLVATFELTS